jgi:hypothetical protein
MRNGFQSSWKQSVLISEVYSSTIFLLYVNCARGMDGMCSGEGNYVALIPTEGRIVTL